MSEEVLARLTAYWSAKRAGGALPMRRDIDPAEITRLLAHVALVDGPDDAGGFRFRLAGTGIVRHLRFDPTGRRVSDLGGDGAAARVTAFLQRVADTRDACTEEIPYFGQIASFGTIRVVGLPLVDCDDRVSMVLLGLNFIGAGKSATSVRA